MTKIQETSKKIRDEVCKVFKGDDDTVVDGHALKLVA